MMHLSTTRCWPHSDPICSRPTICRLQETVGLDFKGMMEDLKAAPSGSIVLLHGALLCWLRFAMRDQITWFDCAAACPVALAPCE